MKKNAKRIVTSFGRAAVTTLILVTVFSCGAEETQEERSDRTVVATTESPTEPLRVYTVNYPLQYFAERIGRELVDVTFPVPMDEDPAYWRPTAEDVVAYQTADLILLNGAGYAKWLGLASLPRAKLIDTSAGFADRFIPLDDGPVHSHGPEGEHSHQGIAFTTWLDPDLATEQARAVLEALSVARPGHREDLQRHFQELAGELANLADDLAEGFAALRGRPVLFSHPVYQYLARRFEIDARSVHFEPDQMPTRQQWDELDTMLAQRPSSLMIWEDDPRPEIVSALDDRGLAHLVFRTCANRPRDGDYLSIMHQNVVNVSVIEQLP